MCEAEGLHKVEVVSSKLPILLFSRGLIGEKGDYYASMQRGWRIKEGLGLYQWSVGKLSRKTVFIVILLLLRGHFDQPQVDWLRLTKIEG